MIRTTNPRKLISCIWILCVLLGTAVLVRAERLPIKTYTTADGLGSSFINDLMRDSRGFLWVCTRDGLSRFDGSRFVRILETRKGIYWIVTTGGLYRFDPQAPLAISESKSDRSTLNAQFVSSERGTLYEDHSGVVWLGSESLFRLNEQNERPVLEKVDLNLPTNGYKPLSISGISETEDGSLWLASNWAVIRRLPDGREIFYRINDPRSNILRSILADRSGRVWVGGVSNVYVILPESANECSSFGALTLRDLDKSVNTRPLAALSMSQHNKSGEVLKYRDPAAAQSGYGEFLHQTADGHIWISNMTSVREFDGHVLSSYTTAQGFVEDAEQLVEDAGGNLWLGGQNGLMRLDRQGLTSYFTEDGLGYPYVLLINKTRDDKLYVMTRELSLSFFDGRRFQTIRPFPSEAQTGWTANPVFQDSAGEWWFLTTAKLYRFPAVNDFSELARQTPRATYDSRDGLSGDAMFHIWEDSHHDLWISTRGSQSAQAGLSRWTRATEKFFTFSATDGFPANRIPTSFAEDKNGDLWFGLYDGGLLRYVGGGFQEFKVSDGAPKGFISALKFDRQGRLWVGSSFSGLTRIDSTSAPQLQFVSFTVENGLASNNVRSITEDLFGNIYVGTARGVDRISTDTKSVKHFSTSDGLAGDFVSTSFRDSAGALWFGTPNGLSRLMPTENKSASAPPVWVSGLRIAGERRPVPDLGGAEIFISELGQAQNNLQIDFFGIDFGAGESLRYQYKLEGADQNWSAPTEQRTVTFANLQPGKYRFLVRAVNADGIASVEPAIVSFRILPPIWQRWWFLTIALMLLFGAALMLYRYRVRQLLELERIRTRIATDLHDDIGASLSRMAILSEVVKRQDEVKSGTSRRMLTEIADSARGLVDAMSDIVWSIDPERDDLRSVSARIRQFASDVLEARGIKWELKLPPELETVKLNAEQRRQLLLIFKEALNNVVRHAECVNVTLSLALEGRALAAEVRDDGRGFQLEGTDQFSGNGRGGNGLKNMRARVAQLGGKINIASSPGQGTCLTFKVPLK